MKHLLLLLTISIQLTSFASAQDFADVLIPYRFNDAWGYANEAGEIIIEPKFDFAGRFYLTNWSGDEFTGKSDSLYSAMIIKDKQIFDIDETGQVLIDDGEFIGESWCRRKELCGGEGEIYLDEEAEAAFFLQVRQVFPKYLYPEIRLATDCYEGFFWYKEGEVWGLLDWEEKIVYPARYKETNPFKGKLAYVTNPNGKKGYINKKGFEYFREE